MVFIQDTTWTERRGLVLASFPGLPRFYLLFVFTIIHGSGRPGLDPWLTSVVLCRDHVHPKPLTARNKQSQIPWAYFQNMEGPMRLQDWRSVHNTFLRATKFCSSPRVSLAPWEQTTLGQTLCVWEGLLQDVLTVARLHWPQTAGPP